MARKRNRQFDKALKTCEVMRSYPGLRRTSTRKPPKNAKEWADYNPETSMWVGELFEDYVNNAVHAITGKWLGMSRTEKEQHEIGENKAGVEIKFDRRHHETGNLFIETESRANINSPFEKDVGFKKSWVRHLAIGTIYGGKHGDHGIIYIYKPKKLEEIESEKSLTNGNTTYGSALTRGFLLRGNECRKHAHRVLHVHDLPNGKVTKA